MKMSSNSNIDKQQKYNRVSQRIDDGGAAFTTEPHDSESQFQLSELHPDPIRSLDDDSNQDDEFVDHPDNAIGTITQTDFTKSDQHSLNVSKFAKGDDIGDDIDASIPYSNQYRYSYAWGMTKHILTTNLIDDQALLNMYRQFCHAGESSDVDDGGIIMVKLVKLWALSLAGIMIVHPLARWMDWEIDENYTLHDFLQYDFTSVLLDLLFFFFVGRLYTCRGIDYLFPWGILTFLGAIYASIANDFEFLRHSISMYDMMCTWPAILFIYAVVLALAAIVFGVALVRSHHRRNVLRSRIVEAIVFSCIFILPYATNDSFHLHHWYGMLFLGSQSNSPEWWARSFQAYALGSYINGIAVYGRDPLLGCQYSFYMSTNLGCDYMQCYMEASPGVSNETKEEYKEFLVADWRTCNAAEIKNQSFTP